MLKTDSLYSFLSYLDECPIRAFKLTELFLFDFRASVSKLVKESEKELRSNLLNLDKGADLIYLRETLEVLTKYAGWLLPNCWGALYESAPGLWEDFNQRADDDTKSLIRQFNRRFEELTTSEGEGYMTDEDYLEAKDDFYTHSPNNLREFFLGSTSTNPWSLTDKEEEKCLEGFSGDANWEKYNLEATRQKILGNALINIWEQVVKMYERRSGEPAPPSFMHEYYTFVDTQRTEGSGYERLGLQLPSLLPTKANKSRVPLVWKGNVSELVSLFVELGEKGYIDLPSSITYGGASWEAICRGITELFTLSTRRATSEGEPWTTLATYFKTKEQDGTYSKLDAVRHKFAQIEGPRQVKDVP